MESFLKLVEKTLSEREGITEAQSLPREREKEFNSRVMIVEDDPIIRHSLAIHFLDAGYPVAAALTSETAIELFFVWVPNLILIKHGIPGFPEFILGNHVRQMPHMRKTEILVYSGAYHTIDVLTEEKLISLFDAKHIAAYNDPRKLFDRACFILSKQKHSKDG